MKRLLHLIREETGQAPLGLVLMMVAICALIIPSLLSFTVTSLNVAEAVECRSLEFYSADAGIENALWKIKNDQIPEWMKGDWVNDTYVQGEENPYTYNLGPLPTESNTPRVNVRDIHGISNVEVVMQPIWLLEGLEDTKKGRQPHNELVTVSSVIDKTTHDGVDCGVYRIGVINSAPGITKVDRIGFWLPPGYTYREDSSNLEQEPAQPYYCEPTVTSFRGGTAIFWETWPNQPNSAFIDYDLLPGTVSAREVTFEFSPYGIPQDAFSWMKTNRDDIYLCWDMDKKLFKLTATATGDDEKYTTLTAYTTKREFRKIGSGTEGDYYATGCTLMRDHDNNESDDRRERLYKETPATVTDIPSDAKVEKIFLYWSGWKCKPWNASGVTVSKVQEKGVDKVKLQVDVGGNIFTQDVTAATGNIQVMPNGSSHGWSYSCWADVTESVKTYFGSGFNGNAKYTLGHWDLSTRYNDRTYRYSLYSWDPNGDGNHSDDAFVGYTRYPLGSPRDGSQNNCDPKCGSSYYYENSGSEDQWAYAAWSVVIIYSSPSTAGHQLYIYDNYQYCDNGDTLTFPVSGFLAPQEVSDPDADAARLTCFVGEGDDCWNGDKIGIIGQGETTPVYLSDPGGNPNPQTDIWNSKSNIFLGGTAIDGVDIDTFPVAGVIMPGDNQATMKLPTQDDSWNLVYIILSFRSQITTGGITTLELYTGGP